MLTSKLSIQIHKGYKSFFHFHFPFHPFTVLTLSLSPLWKKMSGPKDSLLSLPGRLQSVQLFLAAGTSCWEIVQITTLLQIITSPETIILHCTKCHCEEIENQSESSCISVWAVFLPSQVISGIKWKLFRSSPPIC